MVLCRSCVSWLITRRSLLTDPARRYETVEVAATALRPSLVAVNARSWCKWRYLIPRTCSALTTREAKGRSERRQMHRLPKDELGETTG